MLAWISATITNTYETGKDILTYVEKVDVAELDGNEFDWAYDNLFPLTGTGRTEGDAWYDVLITDSSNEELIGRTFYFGY